MQDEDLILLESSLRNYMLNSVDVSHGGSAMKYRGLNLLIDSSDKNNLMFKVRIAAFEASFRVSDGQKVNGSLCGDEKLVSKWFHRGYNKQQLNDIVVGSSKKTAEKVRQSVTTSFVESFVEKNK